MAHLSLFPCLGRHGSWLAKQAQHPEKQELERSKATQKSTLSLTPRHALQCGSSRSWLDMPCFHKVFVATPPEAGKSADFHHRFKADLCGRACTPPTFPKALLLSHHWGRSRPHCLQQGHCSVSNVIVAFFVAPRWSHKWLLHIL